MKSLFNLNHRTQVALLLLVITASFSWTGYVLKPKLFPPPRKPNILVVSLCSLRYQHLAAYGYTGPELTPNINKFIEGSGYVFENAFNGMPWVGLFAPARANIPINLFKREGYELLGNAERHHILRIPESSIRKAKHKKAAPVSAFEQNTLEKKHGAALQNLRKILTSSFTGPFYLIAHLKYLHFPLIDRHNPDAEWDVFLTDEEKKKVAAYLEAPGRYPEKLPFLLLLSHDKQVLNSNAELKSLGSKVDAEKFSGLMTSPQFLKRWKESSGYSDDLKILDKIYSANLRYLDKAIGDLLDLYGSKDLQENTIVILAGDHGELHMERDQLTHATTVFDEALRVPLAIRFPDGEGAPVRMKEQVDFVAIAGLLEQVIEGRVSADNVPTTLKRLNSDVFLSRDCSNTLRGLRYKNKYKYFVEIASGKRYLFDLEQDPGEQQNLVLSQPQVVARMEEMFWANYDEFSTQDTYSCAPWVDGI